MIHKYTPSSHRKDWIQISILVVLLGLATLARAQEGSQGNTTIFGGAEMTFFGNHNFVTGGGGTQPGVILTQRATGNFGILSYSGNNLTATGVSNTGYVDGYVKKYGTGQFIFPVGDNGNAGQFAASADGTMGAYFFANPQTAITSNLFTGGNYPALPTGGPFPIGMTTRGAGIKAVSNVEYWDIDGATATPITLTWDAGSNVATLTGSILSTLTIVGWDGSKWVRIPSIVDATSILGGPSAVTGGSITTQLPIVPNTYIAYTLAGVGPDVTPRITTDQLVVNGTETMEVVVSVIEVGAITSTTGAPITVRVAKNPLLSGFTWNPAQTTSAASGVSVQNSIWTPSEDASFYIFTTTAVIPRSSQRRLAFNITMTPGATQGKFALTTSIPNNGSGGEVNILNNQDAVIIDFFAN
jgi:hypothetical protein